MENSTKFIFNPEHDLCLASGDVNFIPPAAAVRFAQEGKWIEKFMRAPGGVRLGSGSGKIVPWGWNSVLKRKLMDGGWSPEILPSDVELEFIRENSRRELAVELLERLQGVPTILTHTYRIIAHSLEEIESFLSRNQRIVLKWLPPILLPSSLLA